MYREASRPNTVAGILLFTLLVVCLPTSCGRTDQKQPWRFRKTITLGDAQPIGIVRVGERFWVSDAGNNRILQINARGKVLREVTGFQRPMHLAFRGAHSESKIERGNETGKLYIPEYLTDTVKILEGDSLHALPLEEKPDAPAAVDVKDGLIAVADFYNHRIILRAGSEETTIGKKGHGPGELFYPTDVKLWNGKVYVADAYNHRVQVFDLRKKPPSVERIIGGEDSIAVASGLDVTRDYIAVTDQENGRVLVYGHDGALLQILSEGIDYPADVLLLEGELWVVNFKNGSLGIFSSPLVLPEVN